MCTPDLWQLTCDHASDCHYYLYEVETRICKLLANDKRTCDLVMVDKDTDFENCKLLHTANNF